MKNCCEASWCEECGLSKTDAERIYEYRQAKNYIKADELRDYFVRNGHKVVITQKGVYIYWNDEIHQWYGDRKEFIEFEYLNMKKMAEDSRSGYLWCTEHDTSMLKKRYHRAKKMGKKDKAEHLYIEWMQRVNNREAFLASNTALIKTYEDNYIAKR